MLNYADLSDVEFEYLCRDIMARKLGMELRRFAAGRDGGIDLTNSIETKDVVVQVKHYIRTDSATLVRRINDELPKIKKWAPKAYYVCCSKELSHERISEIYHTYRDYMDSDANIITLIEIDSFLMKPENADILREHYKLWISSTNILSEIYNNDIFIDCETLLADIEREKQLFVRTNAYDSAMKRLETKRVLMIIGNPGVGKTLTSKMLVLSFAAEGYRVRYTTNGTDLSSLKRALSQDRLVKEVILLDDCFGQAYFTMKETQENELLSLIKFVNMSNNKVLILNSRVTIYREAQIRTPVLLESEIRDYNVATIDMSLVSAVDKAKIFYNHLYFNSIPEDYFASIRENRNYRNIVRHKNYNPRIIEFVSSNRQLATVKPEDFYNFVIENLNNPSTAWSNEYERRIEKVDRLLLLTVYSLTLTTVPLAVAKKCFWNRVIAEGNIDTTVDHFENGVNRLEGAFLRIVDYHGTPSLSVLNPSINDFLQSKLANNIAERNRIIASALSVRQYDRLKCYDELYAQFVTGRVVEFLFESEDEKILYITHFIALHRITLEIYRPYVLRFLYCFSSLHHSLITPWKNCEVLEYLMVEPLISFYKVDDTCKEFQVFKKILESLPFDDVIDVVKLCTRIWEHDTQLQQLCANAVKTTAEEYCDSIDAGEFDVDVFEVISYASRVVEDGFEEVDSDKAVKELESIVEGKAKDYIKDKMMEIPEKFRMDDLEIDLLSTDISGAEDIIRGFMTNDGNDWLEDARMARAEEDSAIDGIFNR